MKRRSLGWIYKRISKHVTTWYCGYFIDEVKDGRKIRRKVRECAGLTKAEAKDRLKQRLRELDDGKWQHPTKPLTLDDLLELVKAEWRNKGRKSALILSDGKTEQSAIRRLRAKFGSVEIASITALQLDRYANERQDNRAAVSTVRNELNVLKLGMNLARGKDLLTKVPKFPELNPKNVRTGFFERHELDAILAELPERVRPVALFLYLIGWRRREATSRQWSHVDLQAETIRLDPGETRSGKGRTFPYGKLPGLKAMIDAQLAYTKEVERRTSQIVPWVFHREGQEIKSFRTAWRAACKRVALAARAAAEGTTPRAIWKAMSPEERRRFKGSARIPHDFRRTAARNMRRAGLSESDIMELCGWETREMFKRYAIKDEPALAAAVAKLAAAAPDRQVLPIKPRECVAAIST